MRVTVHLNKFYDWVPVPDDVKVTDADIKAEKVKPSGGGGYLMRVPKVGDTHTTVTMPEEQVIAKIIHDKTRPEGGRTLTRKQAVAFYLSEHVMPQQAHRTWITKVEVHDPDGPDEAMMRAMLAPHVASGNIDAADVEAHVAAYKETATSDDHVAQLHAHFRVGKVPTAPAETGKVST
jgi:hypothetical protein